MDCTNWFYLCLTLCGTLLAALAMFFNYSLKLDWRTAKLEKKNGKELKEIQSFFKLCKKLEAEQVSFEKLRKEVQAIKNGNLSNLPKEKTTP